MIHLALFGLYLISLIGFGAFVLNFSSLLKNERLSKFNSWIVFSLCFGLCANLLCSHLLGYILQSFSLACKSVTVILFLIGTYWWIFFSKENFQKLRITSSEIFVTLIATALAISCGLRGNSTDSDNTHIPWSSCIALNDIYPPRLPIDPSTDLSFYHFGTDLFVSSINIITGADPWNAISMQVFIGVLLVFLAIYSLFCSFIDSKKINLISTLVVFFYTCETSIIFFFEHFQEIKIGNLISFIKQWQEVSLVSATDIPYFSTLISQNMSLAPLILVFIIIFFQKQNDTKISKLIHYTCIMLFSYSSYSCYPAWWYTSLAAIIFFKLIYSLRTGLWLNSFLVSMSFILAKFWAFDGNAGDLNGVKALFFRPKLYWEHYSMGFMKYFDFSKESSIRILPDFVSGKIVFDVPLFNWLSFINWGSLLIIACLIIIVYPKKIWQNNSWFFFITSIPGLVFPFLFDYILRPSEVYRFTAWGKISLLFFIMINIAFEISNKQGIAYLLSKNIIIRYIIYFFLCLLCLPGLFRTIPYIHYVSFSQEDLLSDDEKNLLKVLKKYHSPNSTCLTNQIHYSFSDLTNIAGFWGVGGQFYKPDLVTRENAVYLMNPILLKELKVTHVLIDSSKDILSNFAINRLNDKKLFDEIIEIHQINPKYRFYKFKIEQNFSQTEIETYKKEYIWVLGSKPSGKNFVPLINSGSYILSSSKQELLEITKIVKQQLIKNNQISSAVWIGAQVIAKPNP